MCNIETILSSSIAAIFFAAFVVAGTMWYGLATRESYRERRGERVVYGRPQLARGERWRHRHRSSVK